LAALEPGFGAVSLMKQLLKAEESFLLIFNIYLFE
jgi:hypothetical protein